MPPVTYISITQYYQALYLVLTQLPVVDYLAGTPIRVDSFSPAPGSPGAVYFCTHAHADHLVGLSPTWDLGLIHCSAITADLLKLRFGPSLPVHPLELDSAHTFCVPFSELPFSVTLIDANHCPGAVMLWFEHERLGTLLHTGDFRLSPSHLRSALLQSRPLDFLILDNTFCAPPFDFMSTIATVRFPRFHICRDRPECRFTSFSHALILQVDAIVSIVLTHPHHTVWVGTDTLGKESLLSAVSQRLRTMIVVSPERLQQLRLLDRHLPELRVGQCFTCNPEEGYIHIVKKQQCTPRRLAAEAFLGRPTIGLLPTGWACVSKYGVAPAADACSSTLHPVAPLTATREEKEEETGLKFFFTLPYSLHSDFRELHAFVRHVKPRLLLPLVSHYGDLCMQHLHGHVRSPSPPPLQVVFPLVYPSVPTSLRRSLSLKRSVSSSFMLPLSRPPRFDDTDEPPASTINTNNVALDDAVSQAMHAGLTEMSNSAQDPVVAPTPWGLRTFPTSTPQKWPALRMLTPTIT